MKINLSEAKEFYSQMLLIRRFEEKCIELYGLEKIRGFLHLYIGEEAVAVGVMNAITLKDAVFATYREHGQAIARGIPVKNIMAEMYGKLEGTSRGRGGSMHIFDAKTRFYGGNAIVAGALPLTVGMALADKMMKRDIVTVCFFGDGAVAEGEFHESMNLAALWKLPVLFICENNLYGMGTALEFSQSETNIAKKASSYLMDSMQVDGMDVLEVSKAAKKAVLSIRSGNGPFFIEALTYRFRAHSMFDAELYRSKEEVDKWKKRDPLIVLKNKLENDGLWSKIEVEKIEKDVALAIDKAVEFAENGTLEPLDDLKKFVYSN
ncbi:MAG: pyruvate dehydrogenase component alpha subunit [Campylobacterota bacterium]|nr:pyruvate dehydrogenase component alpha subunit [Campylobacterota bacterium]MDQ1340533.1 pyruvate dehydrogenase component alpha subunit [Campylobacterota bacterium]